jgi:large repetitive protein
MERPPHTVTILNGTLPPGLTLTSGGLLSGTPTGTGGFYSIDVRVQDAVGRTGTWSYTIGITGSVSIQPTTIPNGTVAQPYSVQFSGTGGSGPVTFNDQQGIPGVHMDVVTGLYSGVPIQGGTFTVTITAESGLNRGQRTYSVTIAGNATNPLSLTPAYLPNWTVGLGYSEWVFASGAGIPPTMTTPVTWGITSGSLPPGLTMDGSVGDRVNIKGTPTTAGTFPFTLKAIDAAGRSGSIAYSITMTAPLIQISPTSIPPATAGVPYSTAFTASGGTPPYTYQVTQYSGNVGFTFWVSPNGTMQGTSAVAGTADFQIKATDSVGASGTRSYTLTVNGSNVTLNPAQLPGGMLGQPYLTAVSATGGTGPYTFSVNSGAFPPGVTMTGAGSINGTPTQAGNFTVGVTAQAANGELGSRTYQINVQGAALTLGPASLPDASEGQAYSAQITAQGGTPPYTFSKPEGYWNAGLVFNSNGSITGAPQGGAFTLSFTVAVVDANGSTGSRIFQIIIRSNGSTVLQITPVTLGPATVNQQFSATMNASGGAPPYQFSLGANTSLPPGLQLTSAGVISGKPTSVGGSIFTIEATDSLGAKGSSTVSMSVVPAPGPVPVTLTASLPNPAKVGIAYSGSVGASGGTPPYTYALGPNTALPAGLQLSSSGLVSGTPTTASATSFVIEATDSLRAKGSLTAGIDVIVPTAAPPLLITPAQVSQLEQNVFFQVVLSATGGTPG